MPIPRVVPVKNPDGTSSSELTISVEVAELNGGRPTLIPTIVAGKRLSTSEAVRYAIGSGLKYPSFATVAEAGTHAAQRSAGGGAVAHGFLGRKMPHKEPLTREKKKWGGRPTGDVELTTRAKDKLRGQISRAERIIRVEINANRRQSKAYMAAVKIRTRAKGLLGDKPSPGEKRKSTEKSIVTHLTRKALQAVGKVGRKKGEG